MHVSGKELVTVRRDPCAALDAARESTRRAGAQTDMELASRVLDALAGSLQHLADRRAGEVERLEDLAYERPTVAERRHMSRLRSQLFGLAQIVAPQSDMLARGAEMLQGVPGLEAAAARHPFRDVHDSLAQTANQIAYSREVLAAALNGLLNTMAGRLTVIATIYLPLTFATGFFGMNFGWMVDHIESAGAFVALGLGAMVLTVLTTVVLLGRAGYASRSDTRRGP
jgi:magnesium transporter